MEKMVIGDMTVLECLENEEQAEKIQAITELMEGFPLTVEEHNALVDKLDLCCLACVNPFRGLSVGCRREEFKPTRAQHDSATDAGADLMEFILKLNLSADAHNRLADLIDVYREECEEGSYFLGAKERPHVEEYVNGKLTASYN